MKTRIFTLIIATSLIANCTGKQVAINGIDFYAWKKDFSGCSGLRKTVIDQLESGKQALLSYSETEIVKNLGRPDKTELINHSEKYYIYGLSGSPTCRLKTDSISHFLRIRFNSIGYSKEILVLNEKI